MLCAFGAIFEETAHIGLVLFHKKLQAPMHENPFTLSSLIPEV